MPYAPEYLHLVITGVRFEAMLYGRNSYNEFAGIAGARDSVDDQLDNGRALCRSREWPIHREFIDSDLSASRHAKKVRGRPRLASDASSSPTKRAATTETSTPT